MGDSGLGTERTHSTGLAGESWVPGNLEKKGSCGVDASTARPGVNDWPRIRRWRQCSPIVPETGTLDIMAQAHRVLK